MTQLNELRILNDSTILYLKKIKKEYNKNRIIKNILSDDACFFKMNREDAFQVLNNIGIVEAEIENVYKELISRKEFYRLIQYNKIDINDENLIIKYPLYDNNMPFNSSKGKEEPKVDSTPQTLLTAQNKTTLFQKFMNMIKRILKK